MNPADRVADCVVSIHAIRLGLGSRRQIGTEDFTAWRNDRHEYTSARAANSALSPEGPKQIDAYWQSCCSLAAVILLREHFPTLKIRFIDVVDLYRMTPASNHPHGLSERDFDSLFTVDRPIIFNSHGYPRLIHRLAYRRTNHNNPHVRRYKERGNINTPLELAIRNEIDRFSLAIDVINRVPGLLVAGAHVKEKLRDMQITCRQYAYENGVNEPAQAAWKWAA